MSPRPLQVVSGLLGVIPVVTGVLTMMGLADPIYAAAGLPAHALLDSNLRFLGGLWLVLGLALFWLIPRIERETALFRVLWLMIFAGGVGRLLSMAFVGLPPWPFIGFTLLETVGAPFFIAWQARLARAAACRGSRSLQPREDVVFRDSALPGVCCDPDERDEGAGPRPVVSLLRRRSRPGSERHVDRSFPV